MYKCCNGNPYKLVMLLRKCVYPYEYMDSWEKFHETSLRAKKIFYSELKLEDISDKDYEHAQKVFKEYCTDMGDYHDLYVQTDTILLADVFETWVIIMICMFKLIRFCLQMSLRNLEKNALKYMDLILHIFILHLDWHSKHVQKRQK